MPVRDEHGEYPSKKREIVLFLIVERSTWVFSFYVKNRAEKPSKRWKREREKENKKTQGKDIYLFHRAVHKYPAA